MQKHDTLVQIHYIPVWCAPVLAESFWRFLFAVVSLMLVSWCNFLLVWFGWLLAEMDYIFVLKYFHEKCSGELKTDRNEVVI